MGGRRPSHSGSTWQLGNHRGEIGSVHFLSSLSVATSSGAKSNTVYSPVPQSSSSASTEDVAQSTWHDVRSGQLGTPRGAWGVPGGCLGGRGEKQVRAVQHPAGVARVFCTWYHPCRQRSRGSLWTVPHFVQTSLLLPSTSCRAGRAPRREVRKCHVLCTQATTQVRTAVLRTSRPRQNALVMSCCTWGM